MNWETIKNIYRWVLIHNCKIKYLGENKYKIIRFYSTGKGKKYWEIEYKNGKLHGKYKVWNENGTKHSDLKYKDGKQIE